MTISGCESNFGDITEKLMKVGGSTTIEKLSDMHMVKKNRLFESKGWCMMSEEERRKNWKIARTSEKSYKRIF